MNISNINQPTRYATHAHAHEPPNHLPHTRPRIRTRIYAPSLPTRAHTKSFEGEDYLVVINGDNGGEPSSAGYNFPLRYMAD